MKELMKNEEEYMFRAIRNGDVKAFECFYKKYHPRLFAYGIGIIKDEDTTKDIVQEAFITFWQNTDHILSDFSVAAYLFKIFHSKCVKHLRMNAVETNFSNLSELKMQEIEISYFNPDNNIIGSIFMHDIEKLYERTLDKLPEKCREIFVMSNQEELRSSEIANKLGLSVRTVENQIYKAIHIMRNEMKEYVLYKVS